MATSDITKKVIADTMKQLMSQHPLEKISVGTIANACGINRNSFYYHFKDKYDLVNWIFYTEVTNNFHGESVLNKTSWDLVESICNYFYANKTFYRNALLVTGQNSFTEYFVELLKSILKMRTFDIFDQAQDQDFFATFYADAFTQSIFRWLEDGAEIPPAQFTALLRKTVEGVTDIMISIS